MQDRRNYSKEYSRLLLERGTLGLDELLELWFEMGAENEPDLEALLTERQKTSPTRFESLHRELTRRLGKLPDDGRTLYTALAQDGVSLSLPESEKQVEADVDVFAANAPSERYRITREIASGGGGRVLEAMDDFFNRRIALKVLRSGGAADARLERRFRIEASAAARLEHPNIVPVYDAGRLPSGEAFFSMRCIDGRSLKDVLRAIAREEEEVLERYGFVRLLTIFQQVCLAVDYAHSLGIVHRDIKPENVMVGEFGETFVTDWGLAQEINGDADRHIHASPVISGTPAYMAPEQANGRLDHIGPQTDIYGLGALLYEILTLHPPFSGASVEDVLRKVREQSVARPSARAPERRIPEVLEKLCLRALSKLPEQRPKSARELFDDIERFLEGSRQRRIMRRRAKLIAEDAREIVRRYGEIKSRLDEVRATLAKELENGGERLWELECATQDEQLACDRTFAEAQERLTEALTLDPEQPLGRELLADLFHARYQDAAQTRNKKEMIYNRERVESYDAVRFREVLHGKATLQIVTEPANAIVYLAALENKDGILVAGEELLLGSTPLCDRAVPRGHWLLTLRHPKRQPVVYPILLEAGERLELGIPLLPDELQDERFAYVPPGPFLKGGDEACYGYEKSRTPQVDGFLMAKQPVTIGEYLAFLQAQTEVPANGFVARAPRIRPDRGFYFSADGKQGDFDPDWPVFGISWDDARAYCAWLSEQEGQAYALPTDEQWEKAARGGDGRIYPWGNGFMRTRCLMRDSLRHAGLKAVNAFPQDLGPFGTLGMAGGVREWCEDWFNPQANEKLTKGGSWLDSEPLCHSAGRVGMARFRVKPNIGFRLIRLLPRPNRNLKEND